MEKNIKVRIPQKIDTTANWENSTLVILDGELAVEKLENGSKKFKWGDGIHTWKDLPYATGEALNNILDGIANGSIRTSTTTPESAEYRLGNAAFAEGQGTKASGNFSHAEGYNTTASGAYSHAEGRQTTASGSVAHAQGTDTVASGIRSHASGYGTIAKGENQTAIGKYNIQDDNNEFAFIVGNGSSSTRSNAFTVDWNGNVSAGGKKLATEEFASGSSGKIDNISVNGQNLTITEKSVNIEVPTKVSELTNDSGYINELPDYSNTYDVKGAAAAVLGTTEDDASKNTVYGAKALATQAKATADAAKTGVDEAKTSATQASNAAAEAKTAADAAQTAANEAKTAADGKVASVGAKDNSIEVGGTATAPTIGVKVSQAEGNALSLASDGLKVEVPTATDYTVAIAETSPEGYAKAYTITQTATGLNTTINIPKDMVVSSGKVETKASSGEWGLAGTYLVLTLANATNDRIYIDVSTLIEYVTSGSTPADAIQIMIDSTTHKVTASILDGSIDKTKLDTNVQASLGKADAAAIKLENVQDGAQANVQSDWNATEGDAFIKNKPDLTGYALKDLSNIEDATFKAKVESSGFSSGTVVQIVQWEATD